MNNSHLSKIIPEPDDIYLCSDWSGNDINRQNADAAGVLSITLSLLGKMSNFTCYVCIPCVGRYCAFSATNLQRPIASIKLTATPLSP